MRLGFVGLGHMGEPIVRNLLAARHEVLVWNRTPGRAEALRSAGARVVGSPAEACEPGVVFTMLADDRAAHEVVEGDHGILSGLATGGVHVSLSTIGVATSRLLRDQHQARGQLFVASPVFGRPEAAAARKLVVVAAGPPEAMARVRPALEAIGRSLTVLGEDPARANLVKLAGNMMIATVIASLGESLALVRKAGLEPAKFLEIVNAVFQSPVYEGYGKVLAEERTKDVRFGVRLGLKDVKLAQAAAEELLVPMPLASLLENDLLEAIARGGDSQDWTALGHVAAENAGLS